MNYIVCMWALSCQKFRSPYVKVLHLYKVVQERTLSLFIQKSKFFIVLKLIFLSFFVFSTILHTQRLNTRYTLEVNIFLLVNPTLHPPLFHIGRQYFKHFPSSRPLVVFFLLGSETTGIEQTNQFIVVHAALNM
jgi:hypothetical protein